MLSGKKPRNFLPLRRLKDVIKTMKLQDRPTLLALNSTQEGHIYSLGSYFGFTAFSRHFFYQLRASYETIKEHSANFIHFIVFVTLA